VKQLISFVLQDYSVSVSYIYKTTH